MVCVIDINVQVVGLVQDKMYMHDVSPVVARIASQWFHAKLVLWLPRCVGESLDSGFEHRKEVKESTCRLHMLVHLLCC